MTKYLINWDNGREGCGTFPWVFDTEEEAQAAADRILADNLTEGVWSEEDEEDGMGVEVIEEPEQEDAS